MSDVYNKTRRTTYTNVSYETEQTSRVREAPRPPGVRGREATGPAPARRRTLPQRIRNTRVSTKTARCPGAPARPRGQPKPSRAGPERYAGVGGAALLAGGGQAADLDRHGHIQTCNDGYEERGVLPECSRTRRPA